MAIPLYKFEDDGFYIQSQTIDYGFDRVFRRQYYKTKTTTAINYPNFSITLLCDIPPDAEIILHHQHTKLRARGRCGFYIPKNMLVTWEIPPGWMEWVSYVSIHHTPDTFPTTPHLFSFSEWPEITNFKEFEKFITTHIETNVQNKTPSPTLRFTEKCQPSNVLTFIQENYKSPLTIEDIAQKTGYQHSAMTHAFKSAYGITPLQYLHTMRIFDLLVDLNTGAEITKLIYAYGYQNYPTFYRQFVKMMGFPPSAIARRGFSPLSGADAPLSVIRNK